MKTASLRPRTTLASTLMRAGSASGRARDEASNIEQRKDGSPSGGGDNRIITAGKDGRGAPRRVAAAILIGISLAAVFGSGPTLRWTETLPDSRLTAALHDAAARWNETLSALGLSKPHDWLRATIRAFEAMHF